MDKNNIHGRSFQGSRAAVVALCVVTLSACVTHPPKRRVWGQPTPAPPTQSMPTPSPRPLERGPIVDQSPQPTPRPAPAVPRSAEEISGAAVTSLMRQARGSLSAGQPAQAASALERALRIEPRNYFVWSLLAKTYLAQNNYAQADSVAGKSNALARGNVYVELENWRTIAAARRAQGDAAGAEDARARAEDLERSLAESAP